MHYKYTTDRFTTSLVRTMLTVGFHIGLRPEELLILKVDDIFFDEGYIFIREQKKNYRQRQIWLDPPVLYSHQQNSLKNWTSVWREGIANGYSGDFLFIQKNGKPFSNVDTQRMFLNRYCKPVWKHFSPKIMRDWCAIARLIRTKIETKNWDIRVVKNALGHKYEKTTENYIKYAENYFRNDNYDWLRAVLKFHPHSKRMQKLMKQQYGACQKIPEILKNRTTDMNGFLPTNGQNGSPEVRSPPVGNYGPGRN